jgi:hypothetical protein
MYSKRTRANYFAKYSKIIRALIIMAVLGAIRVDAALFHLIASKNTYHSKLIGKWKVSTTVIWSDCPYVTVGENSESILAITDTNGRLFPQWKAYEWKLVRNNSISFTGDDSLLWERENKLFKDGKYWFIEAVDEFSFDGYDQLKGKSTINQYLNGKYVGSYVTDSRLEKITELERVAKSDS